MKVKLDEITLKRIILLVAGDFLAFLLFVWIGRSNHALALTDVGAVIWTAAPFMIAWFVISPWLGLFQIEISESWRKFLPRFLVAWVLLGGPLGLILRNIFLQRPLIGGIIPSFAIVTLLVTTLFLLIWRLGYIWWHTRQYHQNRPMEGL